MLLQIIWDPSPEIFRIGAIAVRWYGLFFALSFVLGYYLFLKFFKKEQVPVEELDLLTMYMVVGTIVGARLGHCFFYEPQYFLSHPVEILYIWQGGLASHGAAIGILLALWYFSKKVQRPFLWVVDRIVIVVALAGACIRLGNLMNSEIYGNPTSLPWGMIFSLRGETLPKHPTQIYEALWCLVIFTLLYLIYQRKGGKTVNGRLFSLFLILLFTFRFFVEFIKEPQEAFEATMALNMGQILSIPFVLAGIFLLTYVAYHPVIASEIPGRATKKPGNTGRKARSL
ncbi:MAG: prolipoprotein diacylglyceryl transferase [Bacteroidales bacterium]|nr:prolipoprotein diacylglyceryl transferase [Bacteroidales bacterium]